MYSGYYSLYCHGIFSVFQCKYLSPRCGARRWPPSPGRAILQMGSWDVQRISYLAMVTKAICDKVPKGLKARVQRLSLASTPWFGWELCPQNVDEQPRTEHLMAPRKSKFMRRFGESATKSGVCVFKRCAGVMNSNTVMRSEYHNLDIINQNITAPGNKELNGWNGRTWLALQASSRYIQVVTLNIMPYTPSLTWGHLLPDEEKSRVVSKHSSTLIHV